MGAQTIEVIVVGIAVWFGAVIFAAFMQFRMKSKTLRKTEYIERYVTKTEMRNSGVIIMNFRRLRL